jgi:hypothetical protein
MLAFCATWLWYFRREYRFPRALIIGWSLTPPGRRRFSIGEVQRCSVARTRRLRRCGAPVRSMAIVVTGIVESSADAAGSIARLT